jgi:cytochrome c biogenesis protein
MHEPTLMSPMMRPLRWAASMRLTQVLLGMLAAATLAAYMADGIGTLTLGVPLTLLTVNLVAAVLTNATFRRQPALLMFHLSLIAIVMLLGASRLTAVAGRFELTQGTAFDGALLSSTSGPLAAPVRASFVNAGFTVEYGPGLKRGRTRNEVRWIDADGTERQQVIGDQTPLVVNGVKFYTTSNKGFAPLFDWIADGETPVRGAVHLPSFPLHEGEQVRDWKPAAGAAAIRVSLRLLDPVLDASRPGILRMPVRHSVHVRAGDVETELLPGQGVSIAGGQLRYVGLRTWMGYKVAYDPVVWWLLAAALFAVLALVIHYIIKFRRQPL